MSLTVKHLNADTTFLLTFSPALAPAHASARFPGSFTILIDPWLVGPSSIWTPSFQISEHTTAPCISSLRDIDEPDLIIISQDKPDHCHKQTLCTLPAHSRIRILATPAAKKLILSWRHFTHASIESFQPYNADKADSLVRIPIPGYTSVSRGGEVTLSYIPAKMDMTKLHNAIGITYQAPGSRTVAVSGSVARLVNFPPSPPASPAGEGLETQASDQSLQPLPPDSPMVDQMSQSPFGLAEEKTISALYCPHGVPYSAVAPYASYLAKKSATPLTALLHSINTEENPWFMGGTVATGYPGGSEIVRQLGAKCWISAHDEVKDNRGWSVTFIRSTRYTVDDVQRKLEDEPHGYLQPERMKTRKPKTQVVSLEPGEELRIMD